jgi:hypothetical protein
MTAPIDIFRADENGAVLWIGSATSVAEAQAQIQSQSEISPGEFLLFNQLTGNKFILKLKGTDASAGR